MLDKLIHIFNYQLGYVFKPLVISIVIFVVYYLSKELSFQYSTNSKEKIAKVINQLLLYSVAFIVCHIESIAISKGVFVDYVRCFISMFLPAILGISIGVSKKLKK